MACALSCAQRAPVLFSAREESGEVAVPPALADERLLTLDPARLTVVFLSRPAAGVASLVNRLDALFPGAFVLGAVLGEEAAVHMMMEAAGDSSSIVGAALEDLTTDLGDVAALLSALAPDNFVANATAGRALFLPRDTRDAARPGTPVGDADLPVFLLDGTAVAPEELASFRVFEPRYRHMVRECLERRRGLVIAQPGTDVGTVCDVSSAEHGPALSHITVRGRRRIRLLEADRSRFEFGLFRARRIEWMRDYPAEDADDAAERAALARDIAAMLRDVLSVDEGLAVDTKLQRDLEADPGCETFSWTVARCIGNADVHQKHLWLETMDTLERLKSQRSALQALMRRLGRSPTAAATPPPGTPSSS